MDVFGQEAFKLAKNTMGSALLNNGFVAQSRDLYNHLAADPTCCQYIVDLASTSGVDAYRSQQPMSTATLLVGLGREDTYEVHLPESTDFP